MLLGFGIFNAVEGVVSHHWLGIHHVNETVPRALWVAWDIAFALSGVVMIVGGWRLMRTGASAEQA